MTKATARKQASTPAPPVMTRRTITLIPAPEAKMFVGAREKADAIVIRTSADHDRVGAERERYRAALKFVHAFYKRTREPIREAEKAHREMERDDCDPGEYFVSHTGQKILDFEIEQERIREAKQKVADDKARVKAQAEQDARVEELRRTAEATAKPAVAKRIERQATALSQQPVQATAAEVDVGYDRLAGTSRREPWTGHVTDLMGVFVMLAAGKLPANLVEFRQIELNKLASQYRERLSVVFPGLDATSEKTLAG